MFAPITRELGALEPVHSFRDRDCPLVLHIARDCKLLLETFQEGRRIE